MDEPTTHLDLASVDALIEALLQYEGTLIFISHDVHFIRKLSNHVVRVEAGQLRHFPGGYQYYLDKTGQAARAALTSSGLDGGAALPRSQADQQVSPTIDRKEQRRIEAEQRQARSKKRKALQERIAGLEKEIADLEQQERDYAAELEKPETYHSGGRATQINRELMHVTERLEAANAEWEQAGTELSALEAETTAV
jgi:ATP-binding cassette subfamily F protein 3